MRGEESETASASALAGSRVGTRLGEEVRFVCGCTKCNLSPRYAGGGGDRLWEASSAF